MPKLQCNVSDQFAESLEAAIQKASVAKDPEKKVPKPNALIPLALIAYARANGAEIDPKLDEEAAEVLTRKPGPQKKKPLESHDLFDEKPGTWLSNVAIATGCALVTCGDKQLSLAGCYVPRSAAERAFDEGWGVIVEAKRTQNDPSHPGLPGLRFIPPGADLVQKPSLGTAPMALADVGAWISEDSVLRGDQLILVDGRVVAHVGGTVSIDAIFIRKAIPTGDKPEQKAHAVLASIASAQAMAYQLNWTMRREIRNGKPGILLIPPRVKLTYEIAPGRTVPVTQ